jgi:hypothetical protein
MLQLLFGKHVSHCISAIARIGIPDDMNGEPRAVEELAGKAGLHAPSLYRVMRTLSAFGLFVEAPSRHFRLTELGKLLRTDAPGSFRHLAIFMNGEISTSGFAHLADSIRTGASGIRAAYGKELFELLPDFPEEEGIFHRAMVGLSESVAAPIIEAYDFSRVERIADIGGGHGKFLASILRAYPRLRGVLYDVPAVTSGVEAASCLAGIRDRVEIQSGSFFEQVPAGCDAYVLKHILHDWDDDAAARILRLIEAQLPPHGRVLVCEMVIGDEPGPSPAKLLDIEMLAMTAGGRERTAAEFAQLFAASNLSLMQVIPTTTPYCIVEAVPA